MPHGCLVVMDASEADREPSAPVSAPGPVGPPHDERGRLRRVVNPVSAILVLAPFLGEVLSTSTPPLDFVVPWNLVLLAALYGSGALICRELMRRYHLGLPGLCLLGAAYAVYEEALIVHSWFDNRYQERSGVGDYSRVWHTNLLLATHLTAFHVAVSICSSVLLVERLFPTYRNRAWAGRRGLTLAALALVLLVPLTYGNVWRGPIGPEVAASGLIVVLATCAFLVPRRTRRTVRRHRFSPRRVGFIAFVCTAVHFIVVYALPSTGLPWPIGIAIALAPIAAGVLLIDRLTTRDSGQRRDGLPVVTGILAFFILLDILVGLGGRYDLIGGALGTALALWVLTRTRSTQAMKWTRLAARQQARSRRCAEW
jgi:hypothetical protein